MNKKLQKEISNLEKLHQTESTLKTDKENQISSLESKISAIESKIQKSITNQSEYEKFPKLSLLEKLYNYSIDKMKEKILMELNYEHLKKENKQKEIELEKTLKKLQELNSSNSKKIEKKIEDLSEILKKQTGDLDKQHYIISPEQMSLYLSSPLNLTKKLTEILLETLKETKITNYKLLKEIDTQTKKLYKMKNKKESDFGDLCTTAKNSSTVENRLNFIKNETNRYTDKINLNSNKIEKNNDSSSSISMEFETNLDFSNIPSNDESLYFIDKVIDIKSNIKPIKNDLKAPQILKYAEPIKINGPVNYKEKVLNLNEKINEKKMEIDKIKKKLEEIKENKIKIKGENERILKNMAHAKTKINIINSQIDVVKNQINEFNKKDNMDNKYLKMYSLKNIVNNYGYYYFNNHIELNISKLETNRK